MVFKRLICDKIASEVKGGKILVLTGMRHVGKTTLLKKFYNETKSLNKTILDFENPLHRRVFEEENHDNIWHNLAQFGISKNEKAWIFIDELQNLPEASRAVKYLFDHYKVKFFLTGSSSFYLKNLFPESMANRKFIFELHPLTFAEFLIFKNTSRIFYEDWQEKAEKKNYIAYQKLISLYKEYMQFGGFPEVVLEEDHERKKQLLEEVFTAYFEKDVKTLADFRDLSKVRDMILLLAVRTGSKLDVAKLASELSVSRETVYNYLEFLQKSYLLHLVPKHTGSIDRKVAGGKKVYLADCGLTQYLAQVGIGQIFEASVFQNLYPKEKNIAYYEKKGGAEIDFILNGQVGLEAKISVAKKEIKNLKQRADSAQIQKSYLVTLQYNPEKQVILATDL